MTHDFLWSFQQTSDGGYILGGISWSGIGGDKTQNNRDTTLSSTDYWIVKIDSLGNKQWDKDFGGTNYEDELGTIVQTADTGYLLVGTSYSQISGDKTENNLGMEQTWIVKTDSLGNKQWDKTHLTNSGIYDDEIGLGIQSNEGCYVFVNYTKAGIGGDKTQSRRGVSDYWIIKFCDSTITTGINNLQNPNTNFQIFPNPVKDFITISFTLREEKNVRVEVYDLFGRPLTLKGEPRKLRNSNAEMKIDMRGFSNGIYIVELKTRDGIYRKKVVKE